MLRRRTYLTEADYDLEDALDALHPYMSDWIYRNDFKAKAEMFAAYERLSPAQKKSLAKAVSVAFAKHHKGRSAVLYRRMKKNQSTEKVGGLSLSSLAVQLGVNYAKFRVKPSDVLVHFGVPDTALSSKAYGHEKEVILHRNARPVFLGWARGEA